MAQAVIICLPERRFPAGFKRRVNGRTARIIEDRKTWAIIDLDGKLITLFDDSFRRLPEDGKDEDSGNMTIS